MLIFYFQKIEEIIVSILSVLYSPVLTAYDNVPNYYHYHLTSSGVTDLKIYFLTQLNAVLYTSYNISGKIPKEKGDDTLQWKEFSVENKSS